MRSCLENVTHLLSGETAIEPRRPRSVDVTTAVASMTRQHEEMDQILALLIPMWRTLAEDPRSLGEHAIEMERLVDRLRGLWDIHLHLEETVVFPAVRTHLSAAARAEVLREMRERRG